MERSRVVVIVIVRWRAARLVSKGIGARKRVVGASNQLRIGQSLAAQIRRQGHCKVPELAQGLANVQVAIAEPLPRLVQQHTQQGLGCAGVLDRLSGKEDAVGGSGMVPRAIERCVRGYVRPVCREAKQEYDAVNGFERGKLIGFEGVEFLELHATHT